MAISYSFTDPDTGIEFQLPLYSEWGGLPVRAWDTYIPPSLPPNLNEDGPRVKTTKLWVVNEDADNCEGMDPYKYVCERSTYQQVSPKWTLLHEIISHKPKWAKWFGVDSDCVGHWCQSKLYRNDGLGSHDCIILPVDFDEEQFEEIPNCIFNPSVYPNPIMLD